MNELEAQAVMNAEGKALKIPRELDRITDAVLAYRPKPKSKAAKRRARKANRTAKNG